MRSIDRLLDKKKRERTHHPPNPEDGPDEMDITMEKPVLESLDTAKSIFDEGLERRFGGINTAPSLFDRTAVFHSKKQ